MPDAVRFVEVFTGRMRPRHRRFQVAFDSLCHDVGFTYLSRPATQWQRLATMCMTRWHGVRALSLNDSGMYGLLHQALNRGTMPYLAEFDIPMAVHGYNIRIHRRAAKNARLLMEQPQLRALLTFSDWACRSFELHYGPEVGAKCRTVYPLAFEGAYCGSFEARRYDFSFISTRFRIKGGAEIVRAFCRVRKHLDADIRLCVVTNLAEVRRELGCLEQYAGVEWRESNLSEQEIADLLADTRCLLHPSLGDSFGVVVVEALAAGCALIVSDIASFPELVGENNGWMIHVPTAAVVRDSYITEYGDVDYHESYLKTLSLHHLEEALTKKMQEFLADQERARLMMMASYSLYEQKFSKEAWQKNMLRILAEAFPELK